MGKTDEKTAEFLSKETIFAEVLNHGIFHGNRAIDPAKLTDLDTASRHQSMHSKTRDIVKNYNNQMVCMILGVENQQYIHFAMPLRIMDYDLRSYEKQRQKIQNEHRRHEDLKGDEYLSGFSKEDRLIPVVTLVIYWGDKTWTGPRNLHDILEIPEELKKYSELIANYPMHLLEINKIKDLDTYTDELKRVFGFVKYQSDREALLKYVQDNEALFREVSPEEYQTIQVVTHSEELENLVPSEIEGGKINMCKALKELREEGREEGRKEGIQATIETMQEVGSSKEVTVTKVADKFNLLPEEADEYVKSYWK